MIRRYALVLLAGCGGATRGPETSAEFGISLVPEVSAQTWYRSPAICGQGPYEIELPIEGTEWGEEVALHVSTPRRIAITAVILADDEEVAKVVHGGKGDNTRCIADAEQRRAVVREARGGGGTVVPDTPAGTTIVPAPPPGAAVQLVVDETIESPSSVEVIRWRDHGRRARRVRIRWWSVDPNDLELVRFGAIRITWRPNVDDSEYRAYLERQRLRDLARQESSEESRARWKKRVADDERRERARAIEAALDAERRRRRDARCAAHPESRDCWGAGGKRRWSELQDLARERDRYCAAHVEDARCWSATERTRRAAAWQERVTLATAPPKQPEGPPPAPRDETPPPKLSDNAEWRPGYWQWTGTTWIWLGGMWRVPESDIAAERTTTAPVAPPPPREEAIPPPPMPATIWVAGFWQWNGSGYVWVPGSFQARPEVGVQWRPTAWRVRGRVHVLVPGGWVRR